MSDYKVGGLKRNRKRKKTKKKDEEKRGARLRERD